MVTSSEFNEEVFVISVAAELAGMHAQTLRTYDRLGLVTPARTRGGGRRYSRDDVAQLRKVQKLSQVDGVNLAGIKTILKLDRENDELRSQVDELRAQNDKLRAAARSGGELVHVPRSTALVMWRPGARQRPRDPEAVGHDTEA